MRIKARLEKLERENKLMKQVALTAFCALYAVCAVAQTTIETDGDVEAQGFIGDGSQVTNVDAVTLGGEVKGSFATAAELLAAIEALDNPDGPCFDTTHRFVDCGNGTVTDTVTGVIWLYDANCFAAQAWPPANESVAALADGSCGLTDGSRAGDWRLPTKEEWEGIVDSTCTNSPKILGNQSPTTGCYKDDLDPDSEWASGVQSAFYWSSTSFALFTDTAWAVVMDNGVVTFGAKSVNFRVWPVRGGQ